MSVSTKDVFVEITSTESLEICKTVMEKMIVEIIHAGLVSKDDLVEKVEALSVNSEANEANETADEDGKLIHTIVIQQVKIMDSKGNLKSVYPSRVDLNFDGSNKMRVVRLYDEQ